MPSLLQVGSLMKWSTHITLTTVSMQVQWRGVQKIPKLPLQCWAWFQQQYQVLTVICSSYSYVAMVTVCYKETISIMFQELLQTTHSTGMVTMITWLWYDACTQPGEPHATITSPLWSMSNRPASGFLAERSKGVCFSLLRIVLSAPTCQKRRSNTQDNVTQCTQYWILHILQHYYTSVLSAFLIWVALCAVISVHNSPGLLPFQVLIACSVQDSPGLLPLYSHTISNQTPEV